MIPSPLAKIWPEAPERVQRKAAALLQEALAGGVKVVLAPGQTLAYPNPQASPVSGYFVDRPVPTLGLATGGHWEEAFPVLLHECAHLAQWREQVPVWTDVFAEGTEAADWLDRWLAGEDLDPARVAWAFRAARAVEMDCEKRVLAQIQTEGLPVDLASYAQRANAYVLFYHQVQRTRSWPAEPVAYRTPAIWTQAPTELGDPEALPLALAQAFAAHYPA